MTYFVIEYTTNLDDRKRMAMMAISKTEAYLRFVMASPKHYIIVDIREIREDESC